MGEKNQLRIRIRFCHLNNVIQLYLFIYLELRIDSEIPDLGKLNNNETTFYGV